MITQEERSYLITSMSSLLSEYVYKHTEDALNKIIDRWEEQKAPLIAAFKKHPNYVKGQFMIASVDEYERGIYISGIRQFTNWLNRNAFRHTELVPPNIQEKTEREGNMYLPDGYWDFLFHLDRFSDRCVSINVYNTLKKGMPEIRIHVGEKMNRVVGRVCEYLNYNKIEGYQKAFAAYCDAASPAKFKRHTVLSINPLDYLTMSFGNSWASCHTIDKINKRDMPNSYEGMYSSGTMSYMLDPSSMVMYTVDKKYSEREYWTQPKIHRQMFHFGHNKLVQGRLYPQCSDGDTDVYEVYREKIKGIIMKIFDCPKECATLNRYGWVKDNIDSEGTHYPDYIHFGGCNITYFGEPEACKIHIGAKPICVRCGEEHSYEDTIDHCIYKVCKTCGRIMRENEAIMIDGEAYCSRHARKCAICGSWHRSAEMQYISDEDSYVCHECLTEHFAKCDDCHNYFRKDKLSVVSDRHLCRRCKRCAEIPRFEYNYSSNDFWHIPASFNPNTLRYIIINNDSIEIRYETDDGFGESTTQD